MPTFKSYNYDQTIMVPVNLQDQLVPGSLENTQRAGGERYKMTCPYVWLQSFMQSICDTLSCGQRDWPFRLWGTIQERWRRLAWLWSQNPAESSADRLSPRNHPFPEAGTCLSWECHLHGNVLRPDTGPQYNRPSCLLHAGFDTCCISWYFFSCAHFVWHKFK